MTNNERDKIIKSWSGISEVTLIKEVATKGEYIQLCIEHLAHKRKVSIPEYELFFHDVVQAYVNRLLTERLVCKAESVLRNVQRDVKCFYYQFACESNDPELREIIMEHLNRKEICGDYGNQIKNLKFHWEVLQELKTSELVMKNIKKYIKRINLESLMSLDTATLQRLMVELYFENHNEILLQNINKFVMWDFLVESQQIKELIKWCRMQHSPKDYACRKGLTSLELKYLEWCLEPDMYKYAMRSLHDSGNNVLRNYFAYAGFFFEDERNSVSHTLQRICMTESFHFNKEHIKTLPLAKYLFQNKFYYLLLYEFVGSRQLEEFTELLSENTALLKLISILKTNSFESIEGYKLISFYTANYLKSVGVDFEREQTLSTLFEFLTTEPSLSNLQCAATSGTLKALNYLKLIHQEEQRNISACMDDRLPTVYDLLKTFKNLDFQRLKRDADMYAKLPTYPEQQTTTDKAKCLNICRLNFLHYIKQSRSAYALYIMLLDQLQSYAQLTEAYLSSACESVYDMVLHETSQDTEVITHCIAFCEMLNFDTQQLRCLLKIKDILMQIKSHSCHNIVSTIQLIESFLIKKLENRNSFPLTDYTAVIKISMLQKDLNKNSKHYSSLIMQHYATLNDYWRLLVLLQYFEISLDKIKNLVKYFTTPQIGKNLLRALTFTTQINEQSRNVKRRSSVTRRQIISNSKHKGKDNKSTITTTSVETMTSSLASYNETLGIINNLGPNNDSFIADCSNEEKDLFALIILNTNINQESDNNHIENLKQFLEYLQQKHKQTTSSIINYLRISIEQQLPVMALLATALCVKDSDKKDWCWLIWLSVTAGLWHSFFNITSSNINQEFPWNLIEQLVRQTQVQCLVRSFTIFYPQNALIHLFNFLKLTSQSEFGEKAVHELCLYALALSNNEVRLPLNPWSKSEKFIKRTIMLLLLHLQNNFESVVDQMKFLTCICQSGLSDITGQMDFCLLKSICEILLSAGNGGMQKFPINFTQIIQNDLKENKEYERVLDCVLSAKEYDVAVRLASILHKPISDIIYRKWVNSLELQLSMCENNEFDNYVFNYEQFEQEVSSHSLSPETLVNFFLYASSHIPVKSYRSRYYVLQKALKVIKHHRLFPNESFNRDQIEYDMIINYLMLEDEDASALTLYHSEYYEEIMLSERCVLYKSFLELKELAGIDDLNISSKVKLDERHKRSLESLIYRLLDIGDVVEALRLQELFDVRPLDLRFVVFCMALAESMSNIYTMSLDERQLLAEIERSSFSKFTKRTLCDTSGSGSYLSDSCSTLEFEEIPSKEKQETLTILQGIASKLKFGVTIAKRIICCYRAAMYLDKEYLDVLRTKDVQVLLQSVSEEGCLHRLLVVSDILTSTHMEPLEIAEILAFEITTAVVRPRFYIFSSDQQAKHMFRNADLWGYNIDKDLHLFLELTPDRTKLGACLLEYCDALKSYRKYQDDKPFENNIYFERLAKIITLYGQPNNNLNVGTITNNDVNVSSSNPGRPLQVLSHKKQNIIYVELLIKAHQAFVHECSMEGIANVLNRAKSLNSVLAKAKSWSLIVRMLLGIGRYREMYFCFDTLIENEQFESLLGQFDIEKTIGLRQAILAYIREYCPPQQGKELFKLAALNFLMYKDLAEQWEQESEAIQEKVLNTSCFSDDADNKLLKLKCTTEIINLLNLSLEYYVHATENYLLDNKFLLAQKSASQAELTAMQIDLAQKALEKQTSANCTNLCICVIQLKSREQFKKLINSKLSVSQTLILSRAYGYDVNWSEALIHQYVILLKKSYIDDFLQQVDITDEIIENAVKSFQLYCHDNRISKQMEEHICHLVDFVQSVTLKYKLASVLTIKSTILTLLNNQTIHYLRDTNFGRREEHQST